MNTVSTSNGSFVSSTPPTQIEVVGGRKYATFNVSDFRSKIDSLGGVGRTTLFRVEISIPEIVRLTNDTKIDSGTLTFLVASVNFPGIRVTTHPVQRYGLGPQEDMPTGFVTGTVSMNILGDAEGNVMRFFRNWTRGIVEYQSAKGNILSNKVVPNMKPFHVNYKRNIETQISIALYDLAGNQVYKTTLTKAFPTDVSSTYFSWANFDQIIYFPVTFSYFDMAFEANGDFVKGEEARVQTLSVMERIYSGGAAFQAINNYGGSINNVAEVVNAINNAVSGIKQLGTVFGI